MSDKDDIVSKYKLLPLSGEGGYFRRIYESDQLDGHGRRFAASILYFLEAPDFSSFHRIDCDGLWHFYSGDTLALYEITPQGELITTLIGNPAVDLQATPFALVKKGNWFASEVHEAAGYSLVGCTTVPEFKYETFEIANRQELTNTYPQHRDIIQRLTRA